MLISNEALDDKIQKEQLLKKVERLCKAHKCGIIDLIVISIDIQANNKLKNKREA